MGEHYGTGKLATDTLNVAKDAIDGAKDMINDVVDVLPNTTTVVIGKGADGNITSETTKTDFLGREIKKGGD